MMAGRRHDTQHNDIQHNDTQHIGIIYDIQHNNTDVMLSVAFFYLFLCSMHYAECHYAEYHYAKCHYAG